MFAIAFANFSFVLISRGDKTRAISSIERVLHSTHGKGELAAHTTRERYHITGVCDPSVLGMVIFVFLIGSFYEHSIDGIMGNLPRAMKTQFKTEKTIRSINQ